MQGDMFDGEASVRAATARGIDTAVRSANLQSAGWSDRARSYVTDYAHENLQFTGEEVRDWAHNHAKPPLDKPLNMCAWGGVLQAAARAETITAEGTTKTTRGPQHQKHTTLWRSNVTRSGAAVANAAPDPDRNVFHLSTGEGKVACGAHRRLRSAAARAALLPAESKRGVTCLRCKGTAAFEKAL